MIELVVLDMAGTTVADDGAVEAAFLAAMDDVGVPAESARGPMLDHVRATMGESKIAVFGRLLAGDDERARVANEAFEKHYAAHVAAGVRPIPGAAETIAELRADGIKVALTTGFSPGTQRLLLEALNWADAVDLALAPADAGRGRPYPDLPLTALLRLRIDDVRRMAVVGDTTSDVLSGLRAGASIVVGVTTGAHDEAALRAAGATDVLDSVAELPRLVRPAVTGPL